MVQRNFQIINQMGIHMRPANMIVEALAPLSCNVTISHNNNKANARSAMELMAACIRCDSYITVICDGVDEDKALTKIGELVERGFDE